MSVFIAPIVEGHAEDKTVERLLHRVWNELLRCPARLQVLPALRPKQGQLLQLNGVVLADNVRKAFLKLQAKVKKAPNAVGLVLLLFDAEKNCPAALGPRLLATATSAQSNARIACVLAKKMFENWLVAGSATLHGLNGLPNPLPAVVNVEDLGGKAWFEQQLRSVDPRRAYSETVDSPAYVAAMDVAAARLNSPSFDKLCRELEKLIPPPTPPSDPAADTLT